MNLPKPYYQDDAVTLYHGDCRQIVPLLGRFDLLLTDPPYGTQNLGGGYGRRQLHDKGDGLAQVIANDEDLGMLRALFPLALPRVVDGWAMVFYAARKTPEIVEITRDAKWFGEVIWDKLAPGLGYHIRYVHENIAVFRVGEPARPKRPLMSMLRGPAPSLHHPHEKPLSILTAMIAWGCLEGGSVLDPFAGSGSTLRAAKDLGRKSVGVEVDERHCETIAKRMGQEVMNFA